MTRLRLETRTGNLEWIHSVAITRRVIYDEQYSAGRQKKLMAYIADTQLYKSVYKILRM